MNKSIIVPDKVSLRGNTRGVVILAIIFAINFIIFKSSCAWAQRQPISLKGVEFLTGFGQAELIQKKDYRLVPFVIDLDFNIKPLANMAGFNSSSLVQFQIEPFLSLATQPENDMEAGISFLLKLGLLPENRKFQPYVKAGTGMIYMSLHTLDQSTQFNFLTHLGFGLHYFFKKDTAFTLEYRFRHLSNAGIEQPNSGIDNHFCLLGVARLF